MEIEVDCWFSINYFISILFNRWLSTDEGWDNPLMGWRSSSDPYSVSFLWYYFMIMWYMYMYEVFYDGRVRFLFSIQKRRLWDIAMRMVRDIISSNLTLSIFYPYYVYLWPILGWKFSLSEFRFHVEPNQVFE